LPFGGKVVVLGGDLRQTLPIVQGGSRADITGLAIVNSPLWLHVTVLQLTLNKRLSSHSLTEESKKELAEFSKWMLDIGEGNIDAIAKQDETEGTWIQTPDELLLRTHDDKVASMVDTVYPQLGSKYMDIDCLREWAILTLTNDIADKINEYIVSSIPDEEKQYLSSDSILKAPNTHDSYDLLYPVEFLNSLNGNIFPQHKLCLKRGVLVMLLRNLNQAEGLCNGTRMVIKVLGDMVIEGEIMTVTHKGKSVFIARMLLTLKNKKLPFVLQRRQYPIKVCYSMTINKS
jgi:ATP-dependent DNA helicase PIF1